MVKIKCVRVCFWGWNSRATLHVHGAHFHAAPPHSLQRRVVITQLRTTTQEIFFLIDHHAAALVSLRTHTLSKLCT